MAKPFITSANGQWSRGRYYMNLHYTVKVAGIPVEASTTFTFKGKGAQAKYFGSKLNLAKAPAKLKQRLAEEGMAFLKELKERQG